MSRPDSKLVLALHIGRSGTEAAVVDIGADPWRVVGHPVRKEPQGKSQDGIIVRARQCADEVLQPHDKTAILGTGISTPGQLDAASGIVRVVPGIAWHDVDLSAMFSALPQPLHVDNDARAAALVERYTGEGRGVGNLLVVNLNTGLSAGMVLDGKLHRGFRQISGEFGHQTVDCSNAAPMCQCGNRGCLEVYASGWSLVRTASAFVTGIASPTIVNKITSGTLSHLDIYEAARDGDSVCQAMLADLGRYLGVGIAACLNLLGPEKVIISGSLAVAWPLFQQFTLTEVTRRALSEAQANVPIVMTTLGTNRDLLAAAAVFHHERQDRR